MDIAKNLHRLMTNNRTLWIVCENEHRQTPLCNNDIENTFRIKVVIGLISKFCLPYKLKKQDPSENIRYPNVIIARPGFVNDTKDVDFMYSIDLAREAARLREYDEVLIMGYKEFICELCK